MTELIELRRLKPTISYPRSIILTTTEISSDSSDDETVQTLPIIINTQPVKHRKHIQEVLVKSMIEPPAIQYVPSTSFTSIIENTPLVYQRVHTPTLIEERPFALYRSYERPVRRLVRVEPSDKKNVHLPKHAKKLVNRFLNNLEHAHDHQHADGNDSDYSIDDCDVCRRLRSAMDSGKRRSISDGDLYRSSRVVFETQNSHRHVHSKNCKVCNLLETSDFSISNTQKQGKHVHVIETFPSNNQPTVGTTTQLNTQYPVGYTTFVDPNTGLTYAYDPNWQYDPSYYTNPAYIQSNPQYQMYNTTVPVITDSSNPVMDKATDTRMTSDDKKHRRHRRLPRKIRSTTIVKERTTQIPHKKTTTYIQN